jgi:pimeloyl-ACP methyl ester carboxylesterase
MSDVAAATVAPDKEHRLPDGRALAYCEYGVPDGIPVFNFHGLPGSRIDTRIIADEARAAGLRLITADRPGIGRSDPVRGKRTYAGWAHDVANLADALDIERFSVVGYSCGGPYALAVAAELPERVERVGLVSSVATSEMPGYRKGLAPTDKSMTALSRYAPWLARAFVGQAVSQARRRPDKFGAQLDRDLRSEPDRAILDQGLRPTVVELFKECTRNGPAGMVEDFAVWARPSHIRFEDIKAPTGLWHGDADTSVPVEHSRWLASRIPGALLTVLPGAGHLHTPARWREMMSALL